MNKKSGLKNQKELRADIARHKLDLSNAKKVMEYTDIKGHAQEVFNKDGTLYFKNSKVPSINQVNYIIHDIMPWSYALVDKGFNKEVFEPTLNEEFKQCLSGGLDVPHVNTVEEDFSKK